MYIHIEGIARVKGQFVAENTGELKEYDNLVIYALEPLVNSDWDLANHSKGSRTGFGKIPIKDLKLPYARFTQVFGVKEFNDLMGFVDQDCELQFGRKDSIDQVKLR